jgi:sulfonate transport system permease protein
MTNASNDKRALYRLAPVIIPVAFIALWEAAVRFGGQSNILPPPSRVFETLYELIRTGTLFDHIAAQSGL